MRRRRGRHRGFRRRGRSKMKRFARGNQPLRIGFRM